MNSIPPANARRSYRLGARAEAAEAAAERMLSAFRVRLQDGWFDEIRLEDIARDADVSVQTVIRRFGGKEGLLDAAVEQMGREIIARRVTPLGDVAEAVRVLIEDYEATGDVIIRTLAQEDRYPALRRAADVGRVGHRRWLLLVFEAALVDLPESLARQRLDALVVATDVYVWKLIRRDMARPIAELQVLMKSLIRAALQPPSPGERP